MSIIRPIEGSGDGTTEYTYQLCKRLREKRGIELDVEYFLDESKRNNMAGLLYVYSLLSSKASQIARKNYDVIHIMSHEIGSMAKILKGKKAKAKIITTVHDTTRLEKGMHKGFFQKGYNAIVKQNLKDAMRYSDAIIFVSERTKLEVVKRFGVPHGRMGYVVMHGLREKLFIAPIPKKKMRELLTIGYIGSLGHHKNVITILRTAKLMRDKSAKARFLIYGTGFEEKNLKKYKKDNHLDNVDFRGFAPEEEIVKIYDSFDVFVFPSMYEGFGFQILEAQTRVVPVVIMKNAIIPDEVKKYAIEVNNESDLVEKLNDIRKGDYKKWTIAAMGYAKRFTWDVAANKMLTVYNNTVKKG